MPESPGWPAVRIVPRAPERKKNFEEETFHGVRFLRRSLTFSGPFCRRVPRTGKDVTHAANGLDVLVGIGIAEFLPNFADVHVDAAIKGRKFAAKHGIDQPLARNHASRLAQQHFQQIEFY